MTIERLMKGHIHTNGYLQDTRLKRQFPQEDIQPPNPFSPPPALPRMENSDGFCTERDFSKTIVPLYASGWSIVYKNCYQKTSDTVKALKIPTLTGFYKFTSFDDAMSFVQDVMNTLGNEVGVRLRCLF
jgi:hypothetical protein